MAYWGRREEKRAKKMQGDWGPRFRVLFAPFSSRLPQLSERLEQATGENTSIALEALIKINIFTFYGTQLQVAVTENVNVFSLLCYECEPLQH